MRARAERATGWRAAAHLLLLLAVGVCTARAAPPSHVGSPVCTDCHPGEPSLWRGSDYERAMAEADQEHVLGDFGDAEFQAHGVTSRFFRRDGRSFVRTDGPDGALQDYPIRYTFGGWPLQQYLIELPGGRLQALGIAWDSRAKEQGGQRWYHQISGAPTPG